MQSHASKNGPPSRPRPAAALSVGPTTTVVDDAAAHALDGDTIQIPGADERTIVRPGLAILYRLAVGPGADHYARRFLAFERNPQARLGWHWPAFIAPAAWAGYRGLWFAVFFFSLVPLFAGMIFIQLSPALDGADRAWAASAALFAWIVPGALAAACAHYLVYRQVRRRALDAERATEGAVLAAARLNAASPVSWKGALLGLVATGFVYGAVVADLRGAWREHQVRGYVLGSLDAVRPVEAQVEASWSSNARLVPTQTAAVTGRGNAAWAIEDVHVSPGTGRLRVTFNQLLPELAGKSLLLAPTRDARQRVRWVCVPVGIESNYLPESCRRG
jgi:hypothetical protein